MKTVLFVCTGNTCRSPMAACMLNAQCAKNAQADVKALSAGLNAPTGAPASTGAQRAMKRRGLSLADHRAQPVTERLLRDVSLVVGMSEGHIQALRERFPSVTVESMAFHPPITDPYGGSDDVYERAAVDIAHGLHAVERRLGK